MSNYDLTTEWINLNTVASLVDEESYRFQNIGNSRLTLIESATEPPAGEVGFIFPPLHPLWHEEIHVVAGKTWWARCVHYETIITINNG